MASPQAAVPRHLTAIKRPDLSRPVRIALDDGVIKQDRDVLDYGCGLGGDVDRLAEQGINATGWDPVHRPDSKPQPRAVVNLGYVVNVIEDPGERAQTLTRAWTLTTSVLLVSARLVAEQRRLEGDEYADGLLTESGTFQKFYRQDELRSWIAQTLSVEPVAAAPGVFYVFRNDVDRQEFLATRQRSRLATPGPRRTEVLFEQHRDLLQPLMDFVALHGRLPKGEELPTAGLIAEALGSVRRAFGIVRRVTGVEQWKEVQEVRSRDVLVFLALAKFGRRPRISDLPRSMQHDVKAFFSTYTRACTIADLILYSTGDQELLEDAMQGSSVGKLTARGLYVHTSALSVLPPLLRVYEGCAKAYLGIVAGANVIKLHRTKPAITYFTYPHFDEDAHPVPRESVRVELHSFDVKLRDFTEWADPPVLHRKDALVAADYPCRGRFTRLTQLEDEAGLLENLDGATTVNTWKARLAQRGLEIVGHELRAVRV